MARGPSVQDIHGWASEPDRVAGRIGGRFARSETRDRAADSVRELLSDVERKNGWQLAERIGDATPDGVQFLLARADWDADSVRDDLRDYVREHLGHPDGVLIVDETGLLKKGTKSAGVQRQYSGTAGRTENCQIGVFLAYASPHGHALIDRALYLPKEWADDAGRRDEAHVPTSTHFATKPRLGRDMVTRALEGGVPARWVCADSVYGCDHRFRAAVEARGLGYVVEVRSSQRVWVGTRRWRVDELAADIPEGDRCRISCGAGSKGPRVYEWACLPGNAPEPDEYARWALFRRDVGGSVGVAHYLCGGPPGTTIEEPARIAGCRWRVEGCFELAKGDYGLDEYEVRSWHGWHRHVTLAMFAPAMVTVIRSAARRAEGGRKRGRR
jgi:SRSO17 transposase